MNAHTKQQQDKVFQTDFIDSQKSDPPFAHLLALSLIYKYSERQYEAQMDLPLALRYHFEQNWTLSRYLSLSCK